MKNNSKGIAKRGKQNKKEFDKILEANYELGDEYYTGVKKNRSKMEKEDKI